LREEYAAIYEALTWLPGDEGRGIVETMLEAMSEEEAGVLAMRLFFLYVDAAGSTLLVARYAYSGVRGWLPRLPIIEGGQGRRLPDGANAPGLVFSPGGNCAGYS
jgi:hypothetical protein